MQDCRAHTPQSPPSSLRPIGKGDFVRCGRKKSCRSETLQGRGRSFDVHFEAIVARQFGEATRYPFSATETGTCQYVNYASPRHFNVYPMRVPSQGSSFVQSSDAENPAFDCNTAK